MNKLKDQWQYAVNRWYVYQTPLLVFGLLWKSGVFSFYKSPRGRWIFTDEPYEIHRTEFGNYPLVIWGFWIFTFVFPTVWVWRKQIKEPWQSPLLQSVALALPLGLLVYLIGYAIFSSGYKDVGVFVGIVLGPFIAVLVFLWVGRNKLKELWQYAAFRWFVYQTPLLVFGLLLKGGAFSTYSYSLYKISWVRLGDYATLIWILIFALPAVWVWRKPIWKAVGFLNKKAEE
jgi:hypothetical protein